jgi:hypothetical protein
MHQHRHHAGITAAAVGELPNLHYERRRAPAGNRLQRNVQSTDTHTMRTQTRGAGCLVDASQLGTSLPVTIPAKYWPPRDAVDSNPPSSSDEEDSDGFAKQPKVVLTHSNTLQLVRFAFVECVLTTSSAKEHPRCNHCRIA